MENTKDGPVTKKARTEDRTELLQADLQLATVTDNGEECERDVNGNNSSGMSGSPSPSSTTLLSPFHENSATCSCDDSSANATTNSSNSIFAATDINEAGVKWSNFCRTSIDNIRTVAPVNFFKHAPLSDLWEDIANLGLAVEVLNPVACRRTPPEYIHWIGKIIAFAGYRCLVVFEKGEEDDKNGLPNKISWINFVSDAPRYAGYCFKHHLPLRPVQETLPVQTEDYLRLIYNKFKESKTKTIARYHFEIASDTVALKNSKYKVGQIVEALDRDDTSQFRLCEIVGVCGDRLHVLYCNTPRSDGDLGFWFSQNSPYVHELGWCNTIGATLVGYNQEVNAESVRCLPRLHPLSFPRVPSGIRAAPNMVFEIVHPVLNDKIVPGCIGQILNNGYVLATTDWTRCEELVEIVLHLTSDYILPINFCKIHGVHMDPPKDYLDFKATINGTKKFSWEGYLRATRGVAVNVDLVDRATNMFSVGDRMEAAYICSPYQIKPATVVQVAGHLIKLRFDGSSIYQWISCTSPDIYPVGYTELVGHKLSGEIEYELLRGESLSNVSAIDSSSSSE